MQDNIGNMIWNIIGHLKELSFELNEQLKAIRKRLSVLEERENGDK